MVFNSTSVMGDSNSSQTPLIVNTSSFNNEDFNNFISITEEIERLRQSHRQREYSKSLPRRARPTREEIFECSTLDDDEFLSALEHQNSYDAANSSPHTQETILDMTEDFQKLMKYFDEDVDIATRMNTPTELVAPGKVAAAVACFAHKMEKNNSNNNNNNKKFKSPKKLKNQKLKAATLSPVKSKSQSNQKISQINAVKTDMDIKEMKQKYEPMKLRMTTIKDMQDWKKDSQEAMLKPALKGRSSPTPRHISASPITPVTVKKKTASPKLLRRSKVKEMAQMFNNKITEIVHRNDTQHYTHLQNSFSPEAKVVQQMIREPLRENVQPKIKPIPPPKPPHRQNPENTTIKENTTSPTSSLKRSKLPIYRRKWSPVSSPRFKRRAEVQRTPSDKCLIAADVFDKLSVKDKAMLFTKFIEDMTAKHPQFEKHVELLEGNVRKQLAQGEVVSEKQESVKHLKEEIEAKCVFPRVTVSPATLQRAKSINDELSTKLPAPSGTPLTSKAKSLETEDLYRAECVQVIEEPPSPTTAADTPQRSLHVSRLTVQLKPSPEGKAVEPIKPPRASDKREKTAIYSPVRPRPMPRRRRNTSKLSTTITEDTEANQKRGNGALRTSLPLEAYGPPKKIRCTRSDRFTDTRFFQDESIKRLFFCWMKEKNGVSFDITESTNTSKTIDIVHEPEAVPEKEISKNPTSDETQKSAVDRLLEEALAKLEASASLSKELVTIEETAVKTIADQKDDDIVALQKSMAEIKINMEVPLPTPRTSLDSKHGTATKSKKKKKAPQPPEHKEQAVVSSSVSTTSSTKPSDIDSESGLSSMPKPSDDSQPEQSKDELPMTKVKAEFEFIKPPKPSRRKKLRRALSWKKENCLVEKISIPSTDSDSDYKANKNAKNTKNQQSESQQVSQQLQKQCSEQVDVEQPPPLPPKPRNKSKHHIKKLFCKSSSQPCVVAATSEASSKSRVKSQPLVDEINKKLLYEMNSPRKIKTAYTLTAMSSPSPYTESDYCDVEVPMAMNNRTESVSCPQLQNTERPRSSIEPSPWQDSFKESHQNSRCHSAKFSDSYIDQGFETGSNGIESPIRTLSRSSASTKSFKKNSQQREKSVSPLFFKLRDSLESTFSRRSSFGLANLFNQCHDSPSNFSTPVKGQVKRGSAFLSSSCVGATNVNNPRSPAFSPIPTPLKSRRRSMYEQDIRRNSSAMQVIREDDALEQPPFTPDSVNEDGFFANAPTVEMSNQTADFDFENERSSIFWIAAGDFTVSVNIFYNSPDRLRLLYEIFGQKRCEKKADLHFGIDNHKFSVTNPADVEEISKRLPKEKGCSHYWFSTGDLAVPFNGKYMAPEKIKRLFDFIASALEDNKVLRFGVDEFDFSNATEYFSNGPKFSLESSYSMLVGLQSGQSNGLEGRSKYAWPNSINGSLNSNQMKTSDLDRSDFASDDLGRLSFSPFGTSPLDYSSGRSEATASPRNSDALTKFELFNSHECEPLDQLFAKRGGDRLSQDNKLTVPEMLETLQEQKSKLRSVEKCLKSYAREVHMTGDASEEFKDSPEYIRKIRNIIKSIDNIGKDDGFKACSIEQLENFMFVLSNYADNCLTNCSDHMDKILTALMEQRQQSVQSTEM